MTQLNFHNEINETFAYATLPIIQKLIVAYKAWYEFLPHIPKTSRYTLGSKIDNCFLEIIEFLFFASCLNKQEKLPYLREASIKLDLLKFLLQVGWEFKTLDNKKYILLSKHLNEIGRMLGGWNKKLLKENSALSGVK